MIRGVEISPPLGPRRVKIELKKFGQNQSKKIQYLEDKDDMISDSCNNF